MPDARVEAAIDNWAPRMVTQGIDYNDFVRTTAEIQAWDEWLDAWTRTAELHVELAREAEAEGRGRTAGEAYVRAALCFHFAKYVWVLDAERNRATTERAPPPQSTAATLGADGRLPAAASVAQLDRARAF